MSSSEMEGTYHKSLMYVSSGLWQIGDIGKLVPSAKVWYWCVVRHKVSIYPTTLECQANILQRWCSNMGTYFANS